MPRTNAVAPPGCPPLRALSFDSLGLIKVIECSAGNAHPQVVARWGQPSSQKSIVSASLSSDHDCQVLAVGRQNLNVELLDPTSGALYSEFNLKALAGPDNITNCLKGRELGALIGVHVFQVEASRSRSILTCTDSGLASIQRCCSKERDSERSYDHSTAALWEVFKSGSILCMKVDSNETYAAFGGNGAEISLYDLQNQCRIWESKAPRRDSNGLMSHPFVTAMTFLANDHRKLVVGTGDHQVRLYEIGARRRPVLSFDFLESPIKAIERDNDGYTVFVGTGNGQIASFDMRSGKLLGSFKGKVSGSIRSIAVHPSLPIFATCGLDRFLRVFHKSTRQLLTSIFLKQPLVATLFDTNYFIESPAPHDGAKKTILKRVERDTDPKKSLHIKDVEDFEFIESGVKDFLPRITAKPFKNRKAKKRKLGQVLKIPKRAKDWIGF